MCKELGIDRTSTTAYHPQGNAMIERTNKTIEESLAKYVGEHHNTWSKYLQLIMTAYRSSVHTVTKYSPYYLLFGALCALPIDCMYETLQTQVFATQSDYVGNLKKGATIMPRTFTIEFGSGTRKTKKTYYDRKQFGPKYQTWDLVLLFNPTVKPGQTKKFQSYYSGPSVVREIINDLNFIIADLKTQKQQKVHYDRLKKFKFRQHEYQKQGKLAEKPAGNDEEEDGFIEIEIKQQSAGVSDQGTKTEELSSQIEGSPEVGQSDEGSLEPKPDSETLMDTNMEAKSNDSGAQPTSSNKTKLNSTPSETYSKTKTATQGKPINSATRDHGENHSRSKRVT